MYIKRILLKHIQGHTSTVAEVDTFLRDQAPPIWDSIAVAEQVFQRVKLKMSSGGEAFMEAAQSASLKRPAFYHRRQNSEFLMFTSKYEIRLRMMKASWNDKMPAYTAQSPECLASVQDANQRRIVQHQQTAGTRELLKTVHQRHANTGTHFPSMTISLHNSSSSRVNFQISREND